MSARLEDQVPFLISDHHFKRGKEHVIYGPDCGVRCVACRVEESLQRVIFHGATHDVSVADKISWGVLSRIRRGIPLLPWTGQDTLRDLQGVLPVGWKRVVCPRPYLNPIDVGELTRAIEKSLEVFCEERRLTKELWKRRQGSHHRE